MFWDFVNSVEKAEYVAIVAFWLFIFVQLWQMKKTLPGWYRLASMAPRGSPFRVVGLPPGWVFGIIWFILYWLIFLALFFWWRDHDFTNATWYGWVLFLFFVNIILTKYWTPIFFGSSKNVNSMFWMMPLSLVIILTVLATSIAIVVFFALDSAWKEFVLFLVYPLWIAYASFLNIQFVMIGSAKFFSPLAIQTYASLLRLRDQEQQQRHYQLTNQIGRQQPPYTQTSQYYQQQYYNPSGRMTE